MADYQTEFANLTAQESEGTQAPATPTTEGQTPAAPQTAEEMIEIALGQQKFKMPISQEIPFKHNGTIQKVPFSKLLNNYRQADHLENKTKEYMTLKQQMDQERGDMDTYKALRQKYEMIQKWSEENPDQWEQLYSIWQNRDQALKQGGEQASLLAELNSLRTELKGVNEWKSTIEKERESQQTEKDIAVIKTQIEDFKKDFPEIDLDEKGQDGVTVREHIIAFGVQNGFQDFESAALKYLKPRLMDTITARGRNEAVKGVIRDKKEGIVSRGRTPAPGQSAKSTDPRKMSYEDLNDAAKAEYESLVNT